MKKSDFLLQIVTVTLSVTHASATKLKWDPYFNQNRIEELIDTPEKAVSVVLENGRFNRVPRSGRLDGIFRKIQYQRRSRFVVNCLGNFYWFLEYHRKWSSPTPYTDPKRLWHSRTRSIAVLARYSWTVGDPYRQDGVFWTWSETIKILNSIRMMFIMLSVWLKGI